LIASLQKGVSAKKYNNARRPQAKQIWVTEDRKALAWGNDRTTQGSLKFRHVTKVEIGFSGSKHPELSLTLTSKDRSSVILEFDNAATRNQWKSGIAILVEEASKIVSDGNSSADEKSELEVKTNDKADPLDPPQPLSARLSSENSLHDLDPVPLKRAVSDPRLNSADSRQQVLEKAGVKVYSYRAEAASRIKEILAAAEQEDEKTMPPPPANPIFRSSSTSAVPAAARKHSDDNLFLAKLLTKGATFRRYMSSRRSNTKKFWISDDLKSLHWGDDKHSQGSVKVSNIISLQDGFAGAKHGESALLIVLKDRSSLAIEAESSAIKNQWKRGLRLLLEDSRSVEIALNSVREEPEKVSEIKVVEPLPLQAPSVAASAPVTENPQTSSNAATVLPSADVPPKVAVLKKSPSQEYLDKAGVKVFMYRKDSADQIKKILQEDEEKEDNNEASRLSRRVEIPTSPSTRSPSPSPIRTPNRSERDKLIASLRKGELFKKYTSSRRSQTKRIWVSDDLKTLHWGQDKSTVSQGSLDLASVISIQNGFVGAKNGELALLIVSKDRSSITLEAENSAVRSTWKTGLQLLIDEAKTISKSEDDSNAITAIAESE
jgi:hypothetical protein